MGGNSTWQKIFIYFGIWLGSPFLFIALMPQISGCGQAVCSILNFLVGPLSILASAFAIAGIGLMLEIGSVIFSLFRKRKEAEPAPEERSVPLSYGWYAIPVCSIVFAIAGALASMGKISPDFIKAGSFPFVGPYAFAGFVWGLILYALFNRGYLDIEDF